MERVGRSTYKRTDRARPNPPSVFMLNALSHPRQEVGLPVRRPWLIPSLLIVGAAAALLPVCGTRALEIDPALAEGT